MMEDQSMVPVVICNTDCKDTRIFHPLTDSHETSELILTRCPNIFEKKSERITEVPSTKDSMSITVITNEMANANKKIGMANKPKPRNSLAGYTIFCKERSKYLQELYPQIPYIDALQIIGRQWYNLPRKVHEHYWIVAQNRLNGREDDSVGRIMNLGGVRKKATQKKPRTGLPKFSGYYEYLKKWKTMDAKRKLVYEKQAISHKDEFLRKLISCGVQLQMESQAQSSAANGNAQQDDVLPNHLKGSVILGNRNDAEKLNSVTIEEASAGTTSVDSIFADTTQVGPAINTDTAHLEFMNIDTAHLKFMDIDGANVQFINTDAANVEFINIDAANVEFINADAANVEFVNADAANVELINTDAANVEFVNADAANVELINTDAANVEFINIDAANVEFINTDAANVEFINTDAANVEFINTDAANVEANNTAAVNVESNNTAAVNADDIISTFTEKYSVYNNSKNMELGNLNKAAFAALKKKKALAKKVSFSQIKRKTLRTELTLTKLSGGRILQVHDDLIKSIAKFFTFRKGLKLKADAHAVMLNNNSAF